MYALERGPAVPSCTYEEQSWQRRILRSRFLQPAPVPGTDRTSGEARAAVPTSLPARGVAGIDSSQSLRSRKGFPSTVKNTFFQPCEGKCSRGKSLDPVLPRECLFQGKRRSGHSIERKGGRISPVLAKLRCQRRGRRFQPRSVHCYVPASQGQRPLFRPLDLPASAAARGS